MGEMNLGTRRFRVAWDQCLLEFESNTRGEKWERVSEICGGIQHVADDIPSRTGEMTTNYLRTRVRHVDVPL